VVVEEKLVVVRVLPTSSPPPLRFLGFFSSSWKLSIPVFVRNALVDCYLKGREREREIVF
jgi:hypothetical protein